MADFLTRVTRAPRNLKSIDLRHGRGLWGHLAETGEYWGASYLTARLNTQYGDKVKWRGTEVTYTGGIVLKIIAVLADVLGYDHGALPHLNTVATAAVGTHFAMIGANHGLEARDAHPALPPRSAVHGESVGAIPPAPQPGKYLDLGQIDRIAQMHTA